MENVGKESSCISILIPVYNAEKYIGECLDSILKQSFQDYEVIIINDGSTDTTEKIIRQIVSEDTRFHCITTVNKGVSAARQKALEEAVGRYVIFMDGDDWIEVNMLEDMYNHCQKHKVDGVCAGIIHDYPDKNIVKVPVEEPQKLDSVEFLKKFYKREFVATLTSYMVKRELWTGFTFPVGVSLGEDMAGLIYILSKADKIYAMNKAYYHYRQHEESLVHSDLSQGKINAYYFEKEIKNQVLKLIPECKDAVETWYAQNHIFLVTAMARTGAYKNDVANEIKREFRKHFGMYVKSQYMGLAYKASVAVIAVHSRIYYEIYRFIFHNMKWVYKIVMKDV